MPTIVRIRKVLGSKDEAPHREFPLFREWVPIVVNTPPMGQSVPQAERQNYLTPRSIVRSVSTFLASAIVLCIWFSCLLPADAASSDRDLFYLVIDRSGSMGPGHNNLVSPARKKLREFIAGLPPSTAIRIVFFASEAGKLGRWDTLGADAKDSINRWVQSEFKPNGETRLYDTVGAMLKEMLREKENFGRVGILVFSDGEDNKSVIFKDWASIELLSNELVTTHPAAFCRFISLGRSPAKPPGPPWIVDPPVLDESGFNKLILETKPEARFKINPEYTEVGQSTNFVVLLGRGRITEVLWNFGDKSTAKVDDVDHVYQTAGTFAGSLLVRGPGGSDIKNFSITVYPATLPDFVWDPSSPLEQSDIRFHDRTRWAAESYHWSVSGRATVTGEDKKDCQIRFPTDGEYVVALECRKRGQLLRGEQRIIVVKRPPSAQFDMSTGTPDDGQEVRLQAGDVRDGILHRWFVGESAIGEGPIVVWKAAGDGPVVVRHEATAVFGKDRAEKTLQIIVPTPSAGFDVKPGLRVPWNTEVHVVAQENKIGWSHEWLRDGKAFAEGSEVSFRAVPSGPLEITHVVTGSKRSAKSTRAILVGEAPALPANFKPEETQLELGRVAGFESLRADPDWKHEWLVGGAIVGHEARLQFRLEKVGPLGVEHRVKSGEAKGTHSRTYVVVAPVPSVEITFEQSGRYAPCDVTFRAKTEGIIASYEWNFGDGGMSSTQKAPKQRYAKAGRYEVRLSCRDALNRLCEAKPITVVVGTPPPWWRWWAALAAALMAIGGIVAFIRRRGLQLLPLECRLRWNYAGNTGRKDPDGRQISLNELNLPGWKPKKSYTLIRRRSTGYEVLCGTEHHRQVAIDQTFTIENAEFRLES